MFDTPIAKIGIAVGVAAGLIGLGLDIASWGWYAAPVIMLPMALCVAGASVYFQGRAQELQRDQDDP